MSMGAFAQSANNNQTALNGKLQSLYAALQQQQDNPAVADLIRQAIDREVNNAVEGNDISIRTVRVTGADGEKHTLTYEEYVRAGGITVSYDADGKEVHNRLPFLNQVLEERTGSDQN
jgi:hypothetical protein